MDMVGIGIALRRNCGHARLKTRYRQAPSAVNSRHAQNTDLHTRLGTPSSNLFFGIPPALGSVTDWVCATRLTTTSPAQSPYTPLVLMYIKRCGRLPPFASALMRWVVLVSISPEAGGGARCTMSCASAPILLNVAGQSRSPDNGVIPVLRSSENR